MSLKKTIRNIACAGITLASLAGDCCANFFESFFYAQEQIKTNLKPYPDYVEKTIREIGKEKISKLTPDKLQEYKDCLEKNKRAAEIFYSFLKKAKEQPKNPKEAREKLDLYMGIFVLFSDIVPNKNRELKTLKNPKRLKEKYEKLMPYIDDFSKINSPFLYPQYDAERMLILGNQIFKESLWPFPGFHNQYFILNEAKN